MINAFVLISAKPSKIADLGSELANLEGVVEVHSVAGSNVALVLKLAVRTHEEVATAVTEHIAQLDGITDTQTLISFRCYSEQLMDVAFDME